MSITKGERLIATEVYVTNIDQVQQVSVINASITPSNTKPTVTNTYNNPNIADPITIAGSSAYVVTYDNSNNYLLTVIPVPYNNSTPSTIALKNYSTLNYFITSLAFNTISSNKTYIYALAQNLETQQNYVLVIDVSQSEVINSISVGSGGGYIAVTPDRAYIYVTNSTSNSVSVIQASNNKVVATINGFSSPQGLVVTSPSKGTYTIYVVNNLGINSNSANGSVSIINSSTLTGSLLSTTKLPPISVGLSPTAIAISSKGTTLYIGNNIFTDGSVTGGTISVIDTSKINMTNNNTVIATIENPLDYPYLNGPNALILTPDDKYLYVANSAPNEGSYTSVVSVINTNNIIPGASNNNSNLFFANIGVGTSTGPNPNNLDGNSTPYGLAISSISSQASLVKALTGSSTLSYQ